jgi:hypothetical protein
LAGIYAKTKTKLIFWKNSKKTQNFCIKTAKSILRANRTRSAAAAAARGQVASTSENPKKSKKKLEKIKSWI